MLRTLAIMCAALMLLTACENVDVSSSSSGNATIATHANCYIASEFPETDGFPAPSQGFQKNAKEAIRAALTSKGYTIVESESEADILIEGSWVAGKVTGDVLPTSGYDRPHSTRAYYLTISAKRGGESLWSAQGPIADGKDITASVDSLMADFPAKS